MGRQVITALGRLISLPLQISLTLTQLFCSPSQSLLWICKPRPSGHPALQQYHQICHPLLTLSGVLFPTIRSVSTISSELSRRVWNAAPPPQRPFRVCDHKRTVRKGLTAATRQELLDKVSGQAGFLEEAMRLNDSGSGEQEVCGLHDRHPFRGLGNRCRI